MKEKADEAGKKKDALAVQPLVVSKSCHSEGLQKLMSISLNILCCLET